MLKPIIVITFSIFLNFSLSLAEKPTLSMDFETGTIPKWSSLEYQVPEEYTYKCYSVPFYQTFKLNLFYKCFFASTSYTFYAAKNKSGFQFAPYRGTWPINAGINLRNVSFEYAHKCDHTITYIMAYQMDKRKYNDLAYDKFSITFHVSNKPN